MERDEVIKLDEETYQQVFDKAPKIFGGFICCEECGKVLTNRFRDSRGRVNMRFMYSHILSKGAFPQIRHDIRHFNILCRECHNFFEFSPNRAGMKIYESNQKIIAELKRELAS